MRKIIVTVLSFLTFAIFVPLNNMDSTWAGSPDRNLTPNPRTIPDKTQDNGIFISTGPSQSVQVGQDILDQGGNAIDAALEGSV